MAPTPDAGWYPDAEQPGQLRWWDGQDWTDRRRPDPRLGEPAAAAGPANPAPANTPPASPPPAAAGALPSFGPAPGPTAPPFGAPPAFGTAPPPYAGAGTYGITEPVAGSIARRMAWILGFVALSMAITFAIVILSFVSFGNEARDTYRRSTGTSPSDADVSFPGSGADLSVPEGWPTALDPPAGGRITNSVGSGPDGPGRQLVLTMGSDDTVDEVLLAVTAQLGDAGFTIGTTTDAGDTHTLSASGPRFDVHVVVGPAVIPGDGATSTIWNLSQKAG